MLEGIDVCLVAWYTIMDVFRTTYYFWKVNTNNGICVDHHSNVGMIKPQNRTLKAMATLHLMLE
jgi:hypothetical protein